MYRYSAPVPTNETHAAPPVPDRARIQEIADGIRRRVFSHVLDNNGGYLSQACSSAELLATLYGGAVRLAPLESPMLPEDFTAVPGPGRPSLSGAAFHGPKGPDLDRLVISPAHYALVVYAALIETGRLEESALDSFNKDGSTVEMIGAEHSPGFESTTGSLAQALSQAGGIALARRLRGETGKVYVFMSDGEFQEGQTWEALQALAYHRLGNVRVIVDVNRGQCDGPMDTVMTIEPLSLRIRSFGASVDIVNGHDVPALINALGSESGMPHVVLAYTDPTRGIPLLNERRPVLHYLRFTGPEERERYLQAFESIASGASA
jgi:transketolase